MAYVRKAWQGFGAAGDRSEYTFRTVRKVSQHALFQRCSCLFVDVVIFRLAAGHRDMEMPSERPTKHGCFSPG